MAIVEVLCQPFLLVAQAFAVVVIGTVFLLGLVLWAAWRVLCRLVKPALVLAGITALIGIGALGGFAYSEYRHTAIQTAAAASDLSEPYGATAVGPSSGSSVHASPPPSAAPSLDELFKTPPASVPAPLQR